MALYVDVILADGPSHYWRLNETSGTIAADLVGSAPGTVSGGVTLGASGAFTSSGGAMTFNGSTGKIATASPVTVPVVATLEAWVYWTDAAARPILDVNTSGPIFHVDGHSLRLYDINAPGNNYAISPRALTAGVWHHVAAVVNGTTVVFYVDGVADAPLAFGRSSPQTGVATLGYNPTYSIYWLGQLDEVAIYPKALTPTQVAAHYAARTGVAPPAVIGPTIYIATVDHTRDTRAFSLRWEYILGSRGRAEFEIYDDDSTSGAYRPQIDQRVEIRHGSTVVFRGKILSLEDKPLGSPGVGTVTAITAIDDWAVAALRRVSEFYAAGQTLKTVVSALVTKYLTVYGLSLDVFPPSLPNGPTLPAVTFDGVTVEDAFNQLVDLTGGWVYRLHPSGLVQWFGQAHQVEGVVFSAANQNILGSLTWTKSRIQHANRVLVRYGTGLVGGGQTFTGNGTQVRFALTFPVASVGHLTYQGGPYPPGTSGIELVGTDATTARPWYVDAGTQELVRKIGAGIPGGVAGPPAVGDIIKFYYNIQFPQVASAETAEAATFPIEAIVERADIFNTAQATAIAQTQLDKLTAMPRTLTLRTRYPGAEMILPGSSLQVDVPERTLPLSAAPLGWLIVETAVVIDVDQEPTVTFTLLEATGGPLVLSWLNFWRDLAGTGAGVGIASSSVISPPHSTTQPPPGQTSSGGGGGGDVSGPAGATDLALARWDGTTGKLLQNSIVTLGDTGLLSGAVLPQGGLKLQDTNASHVLQINCGSNLTAERVLFINPGDANRSLTLTADATIPIPNPLPVSQGGTGLQNLTTGDLLVATSPTSLARFAIGPANAVLGVNTGGTYPTWLPPMGGTVVGPAAAVAWQLAYFLDATGKVLANTGATTNPAGSLIVPAGAAFAITDRVVLVSPADSVLQLVGYGVEFSRLQFGGAGNTFPALKRNGTYLDVVRADDSMLTGLRTGSLDTHGLAILHTGARLLGTLNIEGVTAGAILVGVGGLGGDTVGTVPVGATGLMLWSDGVTPYWGPPPVPTGGTGGLGDVVGPASAVPDQVAVYANSTGKTIKTSPVLVQASGDVVLPTGGRLRFGATDPDHDAVLTRTGTGYPTVVALREADDVAWGNFECGKLDAFSGVNASSGIFTTNVDVLGVLTAHSNLYADVGISERLRSSKMGDWVDVPYSAANFTTSSAAVWTVEAADVTTLRYTLVGNTMIVLFEVGPTSINTAVTGLRIALPSGIPTKGTRTVGLGYNNGTSVATTILAAVGQTFLTITANFGVNWAVSTNNTYVQGQITIPM